MQREKIINLASALLVLSLVFGYVGYSFGENLFDPAMIVMFGLTLLFILWALLAKPEQTEWTCEQCQAKLVRKQIKFGLCPNCGIKLKNFRGASPYTWI
jgi:protein-S-isoprenylcysteine O-methyltransferase Ste14